MGRDRTKQFDNRPMSTMPSESTLNNENMNELYDVAEDITLNIDKLFELLPSLERIHKRALDADAQSRSHKELEKRTNNATKQIAKVRNDIASLDGYISEFQSKPAQQRVAKTQQQKLRQKFLDFIGQYQDMEFEYREKYKNRVERQLKIVHPKASDREIEEMMETQENSQMFGQQVLQSRKFQDTKAALDEVEQRHQDLMKIEKNVIELHQLFTEMTLMIQQQGEVIDDIETHVSNTVNYTEQANQEIDKAIEHRRSTRKKMWCCCVLGIILVALIVLIILWQLFPTVLGLANSSKEQKPANK